MKTRMSIRRFLAIETNRHRWRYRALLGLERYDDPARSIPGADHPLIVGPFLVSRPYPMGNDTLRRLVAWADEHGLELRVGGLTSWHPLTVIVEAWKREWWEAIKDRAGQYGDAFQSGLYLLVHRRIHGLYARVYRPSHRYPDGMESGAYVLITETLVEHTGKREPTEFVSLKAPYFFHEPEPFM